MQDDLIGESIHRLCFGFLKGFRSVDRGRTKIENTTTHIRLKTSNKAAPSLRSETVVTGLASSYVAKNEKNASVSLRWISVISTTRVYGSNGPVPALALTHWRCVQFALCKSA